MSEVYIVAPERLLMREYFESVCATHDGWAQKPKDYRDTIVRRMERGCFEKTIDSCIRDGVDRRWKEKRFKERYSTECYYVLSNLNLVGLASSHYLLDQILQGNIDPSHVAKMSSYDLCPDASQAERDEIDLRRNIKVDIKVSRAYTCAKCGKNETSIRKFQGHASDEDNSLSIKCMGCGHIWRKH